MWNHNIFFNELVQLQYPPWEPCCAQRLTVWQDHHHHTKKTLLGLMAWTASASLASSCNLSGFPWLINRLASWPELPHLSRALTGLPCLLASASLRMLCSDSLPLIFILKKVFPFKTQHAASGSLPPVAWETLLQTPLQASAAALPQAVQMPPAAPACWTWEFSSWKCLGRYLPLQTAQ